MLRVGITGGIGSGKSLVCNIIGTMGYPVYNADFEARVLTDTHPQIIDGVKSLFGNSIYIEGKLDRKRVAAEVFVNKLLLERLNSIIHPVVAEHFENWARGKSGHKLVFKEAAILFESGAYKQVDKSIVVYASDDIRIKRVCQRDGISELEVKNRIANQIPQDQIIGRADFVIKNDEDKMLVPQVVEIINILLDY
jgi:dephospho-CoA kinase